MHIFRSTFCALAALAVLVACALAQPAAAKPRVEEVRIGAHPEFTRFVLELDAAPAYRVFALADPYRIVIDLPEIDWPTPASGQNGGLIGDLRYGLFTPTTRAIVWWSISNERTAPRSWRRNWIGALCHKSNCR